MSDKDTLFYDVSGRDDDIYLQHFRMDGFVQDWLHFHSKYELTLTLSGRVDIVSDGRLFYCDKPYLRLHKPYSFHTVNAHAGELYDCYVFYFSDESLRRLGVDDGLLPIDARRLFRDDITIIELEGDALECAKALAGITLLDIDDSMRQAVLSGMLILADKYRGSAQNRKQPLGYLEGVIDYINEHFSEKLTLAELAKRFFISDQKLCADFKSLMNETLHHYIISVRIAKAAMMMAKRGISPCIAAAECGFTDEVHFAKTFKGRIGMTPYQFSKQVSSQVEFHGEFDEKNTIV